MELNVFGSQVSRHHCTVFQLGNGIGYRIVDQDRGKAVRVGDFSEIGSIDITPIDQLFLIAVTSEKVEYAMVTRITSSEKG
jgi:hypothetical protein